ncbi:MAG: Fic family protein [Pseudonocardia sediminis]
MTDPYVDLDTGALQNLLGITDPAELAQDEAELSALRLIELRAEPLPGAYDLDHLQDVHWFLFQDVYAWAGRLRTVTLGRRQMFCRPENLESTADGIFTDLARDDHLRGRDVAAFLDGLTTLLARLNLLHPFREGNGRTQRAFLSQLATDAGYLLRWTAMDRDRNIAASRAAHDGDLGPLRAMLAPLVHPLDELPPGGPGS